MGGGRTTYKLIKVERTLNTYNNIGNVNIGEVNIDHIPFSVLEKIIKPREDDPLLYDGYVLSGNQISELNFFLANKIAPNFNLHFYVLEATGIYDWGERKEE